MIANKQGIFTLPDFTTQVKRHLFELKMFIVEGQ